MKPSGRQEWMEVLSGPGRMAGKDARGGFAYDLDLSFPGLATAIHAGNSLRDELKPVAVISARERQREEDTATDQVIRACPSTVWALDSRAEYDLNRPVQAALPLVPEMFWGQQVYRAPLSAALIRRSREKYTAFYAFMEALLSTLLARHGACVVYDIHAYNIERQLAKGHPSPPVFNLGTRCVDRRRWYPAIEGWLGHLGDITVPGLATSVAENDVFEGRGEFCRYLTQWDSRVLMLPTEIAKVYMDELTGEVHPPRVEALKYGLARAVVAHGQEFQRKYCSREK